MAFLFQKKRYLDKIKPDIARNNKHLEEKGDIFYQKAAVKPCAFRPGISGDGISDSSRAT
jgi:hypothetical protein